MNLSFKQWASIPLILLFSISLAGCNQVRGDKEPEVVKKQSQRLRMLNSNEVHALFIGKTGESFNMSNGVTSFTYYASDGKARQERLWRKRFGQWRILENGQICLKFGKKSESCRYIGEKRGKYLKYKKEKDGKLKAIIRYRNILQGNVLKL